MVTYLNFWKYKIKPKKKQVDFLIVTYHSNRIDRNILRNKSSWQVW